MTYRLWKEANLQSRLAVSPFVIVNIESGGKILAKNIGRSPAFDIKMESFVFMLTHPNEDKVEKYTLLFDRLNLLEVDSTAELQFETCLPDGRVSRGIDLSSRLNPQYQNEYTIRLTMIYRNMLGKKYLTRIQTGKGGLRILSTGRFGGWERLRCLAESVKENVIMKLKRLKWPFP